MNLARPLLLGLLSSLLLVGVASATPITFQLDNVVQTGGLDSPQTYDPTLPIVGSGDIDFGAGTGTLSLPDYSITIDALNNAVDDARLDIAGWTQTISAIDMDGNITSTGAGTVDCVDLGNEGGLGGFICPGVSPTVAGWPPIGAGSSAMLDTGNQTITVVDASGDPATAGIITSYYSYSVVPEPSTGLLVCLGLAGLGVSGRRRRA